MVTDVNENYFSGSEVGIGLIPLQIKSLGDTDLFRYDLEKKKRRKDWIKEKRVYSENIGEYLENWRFGVGFIWFQAPDSTVNYQANQLTNAASTFLHIITKWVARGIQKFVEFTLDYQWP